VLQVLQVTSPAGKGKEKEFRMEMEMFTMSLRGVWRDHPGSGPDEYPRVLTTRFV